MNKHKVPKQMWNKWSLKAREAFNWMFESMQDQQYYVHTKAVEVPDAHWKVTRWNVAVEMAFFVDKVKE